MADFHLFDPRRSHARLLYALLVGALAWLAAGPLELAWPTRAMIGGDAAGLTLLLLVAFVVLETKSVDTRRRAASEDAGRKLVWFIVLTASTFAIFATTFVLRQSRSYDHGEATLVLILSLVTALTAWLLTHASFTLRYAHLFYRGGTEEEGGIEFPHEKGDASDPDDLDFAYFAFTIGMCFQVSDANISDRGIRRTALAHAMLSFVYNTGIIALVLNVATSRVG